MLLYTTTFFQFLNHDSEKGDPKVTVETNREGIKQIF